MADIKEYIDAFEFWVIRIACAVGATFVPIGGVIYWKEYHATRFYYAPRALEEPYTHLIKALHVQYETQKAATMAAQKWEEALARIDPLAVIQQLKQEKEWAFVEADHASMKLNQAQHQLQEQCDMLRDHKATRYLCDPMHLQHDVIAEAKEAHEAPIQIIFQ